MLPMDVALVGDQAQARRALVRMIFSERVVLATEGRNTTSPAPAQAAEGAGSPPDVVIIGIGRSSTGSSGDGSGGESITEVIGKLLVDPSITAVALVRGGSGPVHGSSSGAQDEPTRPRAGKTALTEREFTVLRYLAAGASDKEIARALGISVHTVKKHVSRVLEKMRVRSRLEAAVQAWARGLVKVSPRPLSGNPRMRARTAGYRTGYTKGDSEGSTPVHAGSENGVW